MIACVLTAPDARARIDLAFALGCRTLAVVAGELVAVVARDAWKKDARLLATLASVAATFDGRAISVSERAPSATAGPRCAYCHGPFAGDAALAHCEKCKTVLHDGCWTELGRCPALGCDGNRARDATRARASERG